MNPTPKKICLLSDHHICLNPRLWKEAYFYEKLGFEVVVITMWQSHLLLEKDRLLLLGHNIKYISYLNMISGSNSILNILFYRIRKRISSELHRIFKLGLPWSISHSPAKLYKAAINECADIYVAHLECAFYVGRKLIRSGKKVAYDFEDWYSRDYLVPERPVNLLSSIERYAIHHGLFVTAASSSMAEEIKKAYSSSRTIETIYNGFPTSENRYIQKSEVKEKENGPFKMIWFSRTIGPHRGIEYLVAALKHCKISCELHLLGFQDDGYSAKINSIFPFDFGHQLYFHSFIEHNKIVPFLAQFDLGLAIEECINDNKNLTISNKILQFIQANVPVLCSTTTGQLEVASYFPSTIHVVNIQNHFDVAKKIEFLSKNQTTYTKEVIQQFNDIFSWEAQEKKLSNLIKIHLSDEKLSH
jgi:hypothetical protein